jgi:hypothetical protein
MDEGTPSSVQPTAVSSAIRLLWPEAGASDRESAKTAERRARIFRAFTRGRSMLQIAEEHEITKTAVSRDVTHVLDSFRLSATQEASVHIARELARLATLETELWEAWDHSKADGIETTTSKREGRTPGGEARVKKKQRDGDGGIMRLILACWDRRCKLLGLLKAEDMNQKHDPLAVKSVAGTNPTDLV